jgi:hypothetical protein
LNPLLLAMGSTFAPADAPPVGFYDSQQLVINID